MTEERKATFLGELAGHGVVARAARAASPHSINGCVMSFRDARAADSDFALAWEEALEEAKGRVEFELHRRAVEGWDEPIYGGRYKEHVVGSVRRYSDRLLELRAKALLPEYRDRSRVELEGGVETRTSLEVRHELHAAFSTMSEEDRAEFRGLLLRMTSLLGTKPGSSSQEAGRGGGAAGDLIPQFIAGGGEG